MKLDPVQIGARLTAHREKKELSLSAVAESAGIAKSYLAKLERGEVDNPGLKTLDSVAKALDITLAGLLAPNAPFESTNTVDEAKRRAHLFATMPRSLREFVDQTEAKEGILPLDVLQSLSALQFRGRRPETVEDWQWFYATLSRGLR